MKPLGKLSAAAVGILGAIIVWLGVNLGIQTYREYLPASAFFTAAVRVPDMKPGTDPILVYNRSINKDFIGSYHTEVKRVEDQFTVCSGSGTGIKYDTEDTIDPAKTTLSWFVGSKCVLEPGQYYVETTWTIRNENWPTKYQTSTSNIFVVDDNVPN